MKNLLKCGFIALVSCCLLSCNSNNKNEKTNSNGNYTNLGDMLNKCRCHAVVVAVAYDDAYFDGHDNFIMVKDATNKLYMYQGSDYKVSKGDTLIIKPNCN